MPEPDLLTPPRPAATPTRMYGVVMSVGIACAIAIVAVYEATGPIIAQNKREALQQAIFDVLPDARTTDVLRLRSDGHFEPARDDDEEHQLVYAGYDGQKRLIGLAIEAEGMGYQDTIRMLYGYEFSKVVKRRVWETAPKRTRRSSRTS